VWKIGESSPSSSVAPPTQEARPGNSNEPTSQPEQLSKRLKPQDMKTLFEWMAEPLNFFKVRMTGEDVGEIHQDISTFVNTHCHTDWTKEDAWVYVQYIKSKYNRATELLKSIGNKGTDEIKLRNDILCVCPHYDILRKVYGITTSKAPYPACQVGSSQCTTSPNVADPTSYCFLEGQQR
jgi:hypothetical protein